MSLVKPPGECSLRIFGPKKVPFFHNNGFSSGATLKFSLAPLNSPWAKSPKSTIAIDIMLEETAALLRSSTSSALFTLSLFLLSLIWDFYLVKSRPRTGVPLYPESDAPRSSLYAAPPFHTNTLFPGRHMQCTSVQFILSRAFSFLNGARAVVVFETLNLNPYTLNPQPSTQNPKPSNLNPQP